MSAETLKAKLAHGNRNFSPFFVLGDPTPEVSLELLLAAARGGAHMIELGLAFSDPVADGPAIQAADQRALDAGMTVEGAFAIMEKARQTIDLPFNLLVYGNLVHRRGAAQFAREAASAGASSLLVPDVPLPESPHFAEEVAMGGLVPVGFAGPSTTPERIARLNDAGAGMLYFAGVQGVTGARGNLASTTTDALASTVAASSTPICAGFGLKTPEHIAACFDAGASIAVVGSHFANMVASATDPSSLIQQVEDTCRSLALAAEAINDQ